MRRWVLLKVPRRGRLVLRWEQAHSNPRRITLPVEEMVRQNLMAEVQAGRMEPEVAGERYERFIRRRRDRGLDAATIRR